MKIMYALMLFAIVIAIANMAINIGCTQEMKFKYPFLPECQLTDGAAIELSRRALVDGGISVENMKPVGYKPESASQGEIFARNIYNSNRGHILWHKEGARTKYEYSVIIERYSNYVVCEVVRAK